MIKLCKDYFISQLQQLVGPILTLCEQVLVCTWSYSKLLNQGRINIKKWMKLHFLCKRAQSQIFLDRKRYFINQKINITKSGLEVRT